MRWERWRWPVRSAWRSLRIWRAPCRLRRYEAHRLPSTPAFTRHVCTPASKPRRPTFVHSWKIAKSATLTFRMIRACRTLTACVACLKCTEPYAWPLEHARQTVEVESGSATDNPLVFADTDEILSGGNFHGAPLGFRLRLHDIALTDLMSMMERRADRLINPDLNDGLPPFLSADPGAIFGLHDCACVCGSSLM